VHRLLVGVVSLASSLAGLPARLSLVSGCGRGSGFGWGWKFGWLSGAQLGRLRCQCACVRECALQVCGGRGAAALAPPVGAAVQLAHKIGQSRE